VLSNVIFSVNNSSEKEKVFEHQKHEKHHKALYIYYKTTFYVNKTPKKISLIKTQFNYTKIIFEMSNQEDAGEREKNIWKILCLKSLQ